MRPLHGFWLCFFALFFTSCGIHTEFAQPHHIVYINDSSDGKESAKRSHYVHHKQDGATDNRHFVFEEFPPYQLPGRGDVVSFFRQIGRQANKREMLQFLHPIAAVNHVNYCVARLRMKSNISERSCSLRIDPQGGIAVPATPSAIIASNSQSLRS